MRTLALDNQELTDLLKVEGVDCKGFGIITKLVTTDTSLSIGAKALYAYFCSFCGNGTTAFPRRNKIINDLNVCEDTYYTFLNELKDNGYIKVQRGSKYPFSNTYTIVSRPPRLKEMNLENVDDSENKLYVRGMKALGYGTIPKAVMLDSRLHYKAKALYAYLCSFAGNGITAVPRRDTIMHHLQITINPFQRYLRQLIECNYIEVEQTKTNGRFSNNIYYLNDLPDEETGKKEIERRNEIQKKKTSRSTDSKGFNLVAKDVVIDEIKSEDNSVSVKNEKQDIVDMMMENRIFYENRVKENIEYDVLEDNYSSDNDDTSLNLLINVVDMIVDTITTSAPVIRIKGQDFPKEVVKSKFLKLDSEKIEYVISSLKKVNKEIKNVPQYILTCLYNAGTEPFYWHNQVMKDGLY